MTRNVDHYYSEEMLTIPPLPLGTLLKTRGSSTDTFLPRLYYVVAEINESGLPVAHQTDRQRWSQQAKPSNIKISVWGDSVEWSRIDWHTVKIGVLNEDQIIEGMRRGAQHLPEEGSYPTRYDALAIIDGLEILGLDRTRRR